MAQIVKRLPTMRETQVQSLGREDPLEKEKQPSPVLLPGKSHGQRSMVGYSPWGRKESDTTNFTFLYEILFSSFSFFILSKMNIFFCKHNLHTIYMIQFHFTFYVTINNS